MRLARSARSRASSDQAACSSSLTTTPPTSPRSAASSTSSRRCGIPLTSAITRSPDGAIFSRPPAYGPRSIPMPPSRSSPPKTGSSVRRPRRTGRKKYDGGSGRRRPSRSRPFRSRRSRSRSGSSSSSGASEVRRPPGAARGAERHRGADGGGRSHHYRRAPDPDRRPHGKRISPDRGGGSRIHGRHHRRQTRDRPRRKRQQRRGHGGGGPAPPPIWGGRPAPERGPPPEGWGKNTATPSAAHASAPPHTP